MSIVVVTSKDGPSHVTSPEDQCDPSHEICEEGLLWFKSQVHWNSEHVVANQCHSCHVPSNSLLTSWINDFDQLQLLHHNTLSTLECLCIAVFVVHRCQHLAGMLICNPWIDRVCESTRTGLCFIPFASEHKGRFGLVMRCPPFLLTA
mmetsp:Transcript_105478/g.198621  ORF Transcript_105478/g.198621 Transcript_105478/m.198621 type:complete len:148 (+) Transcript_105478:836-1279(+)